MKKLLSAKSRFFRQNEYERIAKVRALGDLCANTLLLPIVFMQFLML
jgi:hypothetical protein